MARQLTDLQKAFLEHLFSDVCQGNAAKAKKAAGYSDNTPTSEVVASLKDEIVEATRDYLAANSAKAATKMVALLDDPSKMGGGTLLAAARKCLIVLAWLSLRKQSLILAGVSFSFRRRRRARNGQF